MNLPDTLTITGTARYVQSRELDGTPLHQFFGFAVRCGRIPDTGEYHLAPDESADPPPGMPEIVGVAGTDPELGNQFTVRAVSPDSQRADSDWRSAFRFSVSVLT